MSPPRTPFPNLTAQNTRKPFGGRGSAPDPAERAYSAPANPLVGGEGLDVPSKNPIPRSRPFGPRLFYPHSKISSDAVVAYTATPIPRAATLTRKQAFSYHLFGHRAVCKPYIKQGTGDTFVRNTALQRSGFFVEGFIPN